MKKKQRNRIALAAVAAAIVAVVVGYNYYVDYVKAKGAAFSTGIESIQDDLAAMQARFESDTSAFRRGGIADGELAARAEAHFASMEELIARYDGLDPPRPFMASVDLFKLSAEAQLERDREAVLWLQTGDGVHDERADRLNQDAFAYELSALAEFKAAQAGREAGAGGGGGAGQQPGP